MHYIKIVRFYLFVSFSFCFFPPRPITIASPFPSLAFARSKLSHGGAGVGAGTWPAAEHAVDPPHHYAGCYWGKADRRARRRSWPPAPALRRAAGLSQGQRVHPRPLPVGVADPGCSPQRLRLAQRDAQRLDVPPQFIALIHSGYGSDDSLFFSLFYRHLGGFFLFLLLALAELMVMVEKVTHAVLPELSELAFPLHTPYCFLVPFFLPKFFSSIAV